MAQKKTKRTTITRSLADQFSQKLEQLPEKKKAELTPKELVFENSQQLDSALERGYDYDDLVAMLKSDGIQLSKTTLRQYLREARKTRADQDETTVEKAQHLSEQAPTQPNGKLAQAKSNQQKNHQATPSHSPTPKKFGQRRLQSNENPTHYPDGHGNPIEMKVDL